MLSNKDIEYMNYTLGDIGVIELLLSYRYKYDDYLFIENANTMSVDGAIPFHEELLLTYASLDQYIKQCKLNEVQLKILDLIQQGYYQEEIADILGLRYSTIDGRLQTIYKKIILENERQWRKVMYSDTLGLKSKICSKCKEELPAVSEFFRDDSRSKSGLQSRCKKCE